MSIFVRRSQLSTCYHCFAGTGRRDVYNNSITTEQYHFQYTLYTCVKILIRLLCKIKLPENSREISMVNVGSDIDTHVLTNEEPPHPTYPNNINPFTAKLFNLNFHSLEVVSR